MILIREMGRVSVCEDLLDIICPPRPLAHSGRSTDSQ